MRIHKKTSLPAKREDNPNLSVDVICYQKDCIFSARYNYNNGEWYDLSYTTNGYVRNDFVWIYPPYLKMKEAFDKEYEKER